MLTAKQEAFAKKIAEGCSYSDAYRSAYNTTRMTDKSVWEKASALASDVKVTARLKELRDIAARSTIMTAQRRKEWLTEVINDPEVDINARLKASDQLNRMEGEYTQKIEANVSNAVSINIELVDD
jgi:phage terminase small subunit